MRYLWFSQSPVFSPLVGLAFLPILSKANCCQTLMFFLLNCNTSEAPSTAAFKDYGKIVPQTMLKVSCRVAT